MGGIGNSPRVIISGVFGGDKISITVSFAISLAMVSGMTWGDNH